LIAGTEFDLVCIDFKGGLGLAEFKTHSVAFSSDHDIAATQRLVTWLEEELSRRELSGADKNYLVIAIDELSHLLGTVKNCGEVLNSIAARGRSAKMHLVMTNQNLVGVGRSLLSNVKLRVLTGHPDPVDAAMLGQLSRTRQETDSEPGFGNAQIVAHGSAAQPFRFALPHGRATTCDLEVREPIQALKQVGHEPQRHQRSARFLREYSGRERARHRLRKRPSIRGLLSSARMAMSR